ncbi:MAG: 5'-nucleotidase C-terminal domain-containing protein, partial [Lachnospiraceae bacterium]|nr:5'-nucleotidase C-terminal domain-containing protein [Lachnospiraceae bacterium]
TNLGDLVADAYRIQMEADISLVNGGSVRVDLDKGDITYGDAVNVLPFGNGICVIEATGQQILDALEWGARAVPSESGGFLQVSGMSYTIDLNTESSCIKNEDGMFEGYSTDDRRVRDVLVNGEPIDPGKTYTVAGTDYILINSGDGQTAFAGCKLLQDKVMLDNEALIKYIEETLEGEIGEDYADPYGQGRITIIEAQE